MVMIVDVKERISAEGNVFCSLTVSQPSWHKSETGKVSLVNLKANTTTNIPFAAAKELVGVEMPGNIVRVSCEPYDWTNPETGESVKLAHTYVVDFE